MHLPPEASRIGDEIATAFPNLSAAQQRGVTEWVYGVLLAGTGGHTRVVAALARRTPEARNTVRQRLRARLHDGADQAVPGAAELDIRTGFVPLLRWVLRWWRGTDLALVLDTSLQRDQLAALVISVVDRGTAIPVAWALGPANTDEFPWAEPIQDLFTALAPALPPDLRVLVLTDRGLWSPHLWCTSRRFGWHPLMRIRPDATFTPTGQARVRAATLVSPGTVWIGDGVASRHAPKRLAATLVAVWTTGQAAPWLLLTDLAPAEIRAGWYRLRGWIEPSFATLKSRGWEWQRRRRTDPARVARPWLVLAIATLLAVATGTRLEDAARPGRPAPSRQQPVPLPRSPKPRALSLFTEGRDSLHEQLLRGGALWKRLWLTPEPWPDTPAAAPEARLPPPLPS